MGLEVKNPLRAQSIYGLMESSAKIGKFLIGGSREHFFGSKTKVPFGIGHPPPTHQT